MEIEILRMVERIIISLGGILSVFLGYKLFYIATVKTDSGASFKSALFSASFTKVGPGVFFALFGAYIMATSVTTQIEIKSEPGNQSASPSQAAAWSQIANAVAKLPDSMEKTQLISLIRQVQPTANVAPKRAVRID